MVDITMMVNITPDGPDFFNVNQPMINIHYISHFFFKNCCRPGRYYHLVNITPLVLNFVVHLVNIHDVCLFIFISTWFKSKVYVVDIKK